MQGSAVQERGGLQRCGPAIQACCFATEQRGREEQRKVWEGGTARDHNLRGSAHNHATTKGAARTKQATTKGSARTKQAVTKGAARTKQNGKHRRDMPFEHKQSQTLEQRTGEGDVSGELLHGQRLSGERGLVALRGRKQGKRDDARSARRGHRCREPADGSGYPAAAQPCPSPLTTQTTPPPHTEPPPLHPVTPTCSGVSSSGLPELPSSPRILMSAGTMSPKRMMTTSPGTSSAASIVLTSPSRTALALGASAAGEDNAGQGAQGRLLGAAQSPRGKRRRRAARAQKGSDYKALPLLRYAAVDNNNALCCTSV
jgi:hypothetical protein